MDITKNHFKNKTIAIFASLVLWIHYLNKNLLMHIKNAGGGSERKSKLFKSRRLF